MGDVIVIGGGANGLLTALLLANDGHEVTVLERDPAPPPAIDAAWAGWERRGVNQFRMLHLFACGWKQVVEAEVPDVVEAVEAAGALRTNPILTAPEMITGGWQEGDERYELLTGRRPIIEAAMASVVDRTPGISVRRGTAVAGLRTGDPLVAAVPHVVGVRTEDGDDLDADLVVDASGRRSPLPRWLAAIGAAAVEEESEDSGFVYFGRYFRSGDGSVPLAMGSLLQHYESLSILTLPADNGTWGVGVVASSRDPILRRAADTDTWTRIVRSYPLVAHWLEGEPLDESPAVMAKIEDRKRRFVRDGQPVATGVIAVGDSWACTNPSLGRGASIGAYHVRALRDLVRQVGLDDGTAVASAWDAVTEAAVGPWYRTTLAFDRHRLREIDAQIDGRPYRPEDPAWAMSKAAEKAFLSDPEVFRAVLRIATVQETPDQVFSDPALVEKVLEKGAGWEDDVPLGPSRHELLTIVGA